MEKKLTVVEVAMEIALTPEVLESIRTKLGYRPTRDAAMSTSVGGIGPLLRERIVAQAALGHRVIGVTLLYDTTWIQSWFDWGQLHLEKRDVLPVLQDFLTDTGMVLEIAMYDGTMVKAKVFSAAYGEATVYFLSAPPITHVVYPSAEDAPQGTADPNAWGEELRLKQSWLVGRGALALAKLLKAVPDFVLLSETPTIFGHHQLVRDTFQKDPFFSQTRYIFNDHTPMEYAHPIWPPATLTRLHMETFAYVPPPGSKTKGEIDITRLLVMVCKGVFGVSEKHGRVMRAMPSLQDLAGKISAITNGVLPDYWQAPEIRAAAKTSDEALLAIKAQKKADLLDFIWRQYGLWHTWKDQVRGRPIALWTRRITGYKRLDLMLELCGKGAMRSRFLETGIVLLIGGRIHQHDDQAQTMVYNLLDLISQDKLLQERIIFVDNFNVAMAPRIFQGADAAIMLADDGREAAATGFMKAQLNGDIILATDDGAIPESVIFSGKEKAGTSPNGFEVPYVNGHPTAEGLLKALTSLAATVAKPALQAAFIRSALAAHDQVDVSRTAKDMVAYYQQLLSIPH